MKRFLFSLCLLVTLAVLPSAAGATHGVRYGTIHPFPTGYAEDFCYQDAVHVHDFAPFDAYLFNRVDGIWYFVGDPLVWGYDSTVYIAYGFAAHHPIPRVYGGAYCYLEDVHHHHWTPNHPYLDGWVWDTTYWVWRGAFTPIYFRYVDVYRVYYRNHYRPRYPTARVGSRDHHHAPPARIGLHTSPGLHGATGTAPTASATRPGTVVVPHSAHLGRSGSTAARPAARAAAKPGVFVRDDRVFSRAAPPSAARPATRSVPLRPVARAVPTPRAMPARPAPRGTTAARPTKASAARPAGKSPPAVKPRPVARPRPAVRPRSR